MHDPLDGTTIPSFRPCETRCDNTTSFYGSFCANNGMGALNTPSFPSPFLTALSGSPLSSGALPKTRCSSNRPGVGTMQLLVDQRALELVKFLGIPSNRIVPFHSKRQYCAKKVRRKIVLRVAREYTRASCA
eukprot:479459-Prorocentrum_minimum.AAC.1